MSPDNEKRLTREECEDVLYQLNSGHQVIASLLMDISDKMDLLIEQNKPKPNTSTSNDLGYKRNLLL